MITGGVAAVVYGEPRFTRDIDVVVELSDPHLRRLASVFPSQDFYLPPVEALQQEAERPRHGHFNVIHHETSLRADVYLMGDDPLHAWGFGRRHRLTVGATSIWMAPIEYVLVRKLEYFQISGSERHLRDAASMLRISGDSVDSREIEPWIQTLGLQPALEAARAYRE